MRWSQDIKFVEGGEVRESERANVSGMSGDGAPSEIKLDLSLILHLMGKRRWKYETKPTLYINRLHFRVSYCVWALLCPTACQNVAWFGVDSKRLKAATRSGFGLDFNRKLKLSKFFFTRVDIGSINPQAVPACIFPTQRVQIFVPSPRASTLRSRRSQHMQRTHSILE